MLIERNSHEREKGSKRTHEAVADLSDFFANELDHFVWLCVWCLVCGIWLRFLYVRMYGCELLLGRPMPRKAM